MRTVTLAEFSSPSEAESLQKRLTASGIHAELHTESRVEKVLNFFRASAGVRVDVPREEFEAAFRLVYDWNVEQKSTGVTVPAQEPHPPGGSADDGTNRPWRPSSGR